MDSATATTVRSVDHGSHRPNSAPEGLPVSTIIVAQQIGGAVAHGNASTICCASHSAVGCRVTVAAVLVVALGLPGLSNVSRFQAVGIGRLRATIDHAALAPVSIMRQAPLPPGPRLMRERWAGASHPRAPNTVAPRSCGRLICMSLQKALQYHSSNRQCRGHVAWPRAPGVPRGTRPPPP
jgi:hypothetical protein